MKLEKKYNIKKLYIGSIVAIIKTEFLNSDEKIVTFCKFKDSIFYQIKNDKYKDLKTNVTYCIINSFMNSGDIAFNEETKINLEQYFINNSIDYKEKMTLNEIETLILDNYNNEESNNSKIQRKRN